MKSDVTRAVRAFIDGGCGWNGASLNRCADVTLCITIT
jgi:hypothetical protein